MAGTHLAAEIAAAADDHAGAGFRDISGVIDRRPGPILRAGAVVAAANGNVELRSRERFRGTRSRASPALTTQSPTRDHRQGRSHELHTNMRSLPVDLSARGHVGLFSPEGPDVNSPASDRRPTKT